MSIAAEPSGSLLAAISRSSFVNMLETCSPIGTNISYSSGSRSLSSRVSGGAVRLLLDEGDVDVAHDATLRQIHELGDDLA